MLSRCHSWPLKFLVLFHSLLSCYQVLTPPTFDMTDKEKSPTPALPAASPPGNPAASPKSPAASPPRNPASNPSSPGAAPGILPPDHWANIAQGQVCITRLNIPNKESIHTCWAILILYRLTMRKRHLRWRPRLPQSRQAFSAIGQSTVAATIAKSGTLNTGRDHSAIFISL